MTDHIRDATNMVERLAKAIFFDLNCIMHDHAKEWAKANKVIWRSAAEAAIRAMREPTAGMLDVLIDIWGGEYALAGWQSAIDAALEDTGDE